MRRRHRNGSTFQVIADSEEAATKARGMLEFATDQIVVPAEMVGKVCIPTVSIFFDFVFHVNLYF